ncbi:MAG: MFS transporter [Acetobacteraceae bacterium]|nr:MFS transporter [Acetobacteraceae bacterium]
MHTVSTLPRDQSEIRRHWAAVLACFACAVFAWGFGFYGQSVLLAEIARSRGWAVGVVSGANTVFYLAGALLLSLVHRTIARFGPRSVLIAGALLLGAGASLFARAATLFELYAAALVMALGWANASGAAISTTLACYFDRQRGLAISLALNGASAAGFTVAPLLLMLAQRDGLGRAVPEAAVLLLAVLLPLLALGLPRDGTIKAAAAARRASGAPAPASVREVLRIGHFWTISIPFALVLLAQVGLIVHLVAFLGPRLGAHGTACAVALVAAAAMGGRLLLGLVIDRLDQRRASAASFASQAASLALMLAPSSKVTLYAGCALFGFSVGNVITFPALIIQREFAASAFGLVIGLNMAIVQLAFSAGPGLLGAIRDRAGGYGPAVALCMACQLVAAALILYGRPRR